MTRRPTSADGVWLHVEEAVMGADDDLRRLGRRLLALVAAGAEVRTEMQLAAALYLAAALLDRLLDLERVEGRLGVEAHQPLGISGVGSGAVRPFQSIARKPSAWNACTCSAPRSCRGTA